ncbi:MAG: XdhC family protein [Promethearchaeota archaeon]
MYWVSEDIRRYNNYSAEDAGVIRMRNDFINNLANQYQKGGIFALVTVVDVRGSAPQQVGAKMLVSSLGELIWGTVGGGAIEKIALKDAQVQIEKKISLLKEYELQEEGENSTGMLCGGSMSLFYDILGVNSKAYIFGGGHICQRLVPQLVTLGFHTIVIDDRKEYLEEHFNHSKAVETLAGPLPQIIETIEFEEDSYIIILTYSHDLDEKILKYLCTKRRQELDTWKYIGMIGSKRKVKEIFSRLKTQQIDSNILTKIHAPIGIPIGSQNPEEIAISIAAEIIKVKNLKE